MVTNILDRLRASSELPSMPLVAVKVLELSQQEDVSIGDIVEVIQTDPALTLKLLKMANSPLFGLSKKVASIQQAAIILGLRTVKVMALSFSLAETFHSKQSRRFDYRKYWRRSLTSAVASKLLACQAGTVRCDEGLVGGLLCDIGMLAADRCAPDLYAPVIQRMAEAPAPIQALESEILGVTHAQISAQLLRQWSLPDVLCDAVAAHHGAGIDALDPRTRQLASVLYAGASIAELFCEDVPHNELAVVEARCLSLVPTTPEGLRGILDTLHTNVREMAALFNVEIEDAISYDDLRSRAMMQITSLSISAEMDRAAEAQRAQRAQEALEEVSSKASELEREAATDALTQIANRKAFDLRLGQALAAAKQEAGPVGLILLDLDHFKKLNDTYGHPAGDEALRRVGRCLDTIADAPALAARYGGEEFGVVLSKVTADAVRELAEEIRRSVERIAFDHNGRPVRVTASLGAAHVHFAHETATLRELVERADGCLYEAKRKGRNRVEFTF